eukprot:173597_1
MSLDFNTTVQHVPLPDEIPTHPENQDKLNDKNENHTQPWSSIICHIIPVGLLKISGSTINSALQLIIPLYTISKYPSNSSTIAGIIITCQGLGLLISSIFIGRFISLTSDEFCILCTILLRTLSILILIFYDNNLILWIITQLLFGMSIGALSISVNHIMAKYIKTKKRGRLSSMIAGFSRLGRAAGPLYVGYITDLRISLIISCIISILSFLIVCCIMLPPKIAINIDNDNDNQDILVSSGSFIYFREGWKQTKLKKLSITNWMTTIDTKESKKSKKNISMCYVWFKYGKLMFLYGIFGFGLKWVRQTRKMILTFRGDDLLLSNKNIGTINSCSFILDSFMFIIAGYIMDKFGRKATAIPGLFGFVIALSFISFVNNFAQLLSIAIVFGLADGITVGLMMVSTADLAPKECKSEFISAFKIFNNLPRVLTPFIIGWLTNDVSIFVASILSAVIGFIALLWMAFVLEDTSHVSMKKNKNGNDTNQNVKMDSLVKNDSVNENSNVTPLESPSMEMLDEKLIQAIN